MIMKKGQVTIWVIIGILLLATTTFIIIWQSPNLTKTNEDFTAIESSIHSCIHSSSENSIVLVGKQGGMYKPTGVEFANHVIPIYYNRGKSTIPDKTTLEKELAMAIKKPLDDCLFEIQDPQFIPVLQHTKTNIGKNVVTVEARISLELHELIDKESIDNTIIDLYREDIIIEYNKLPKIAEEIIEVQQVDKLPVSKIMDIATENNVEFEFITVDDTLLISLVDNDLFKEPYYFTFGLQYEEKSFDESIRLQEELNAVIQ
jgi:hypothetical protein